jgi:HAE1 family hydrophobic/amphiphilic exporter-1
MASREGDLILAEENILRVENNLRSKITSDRNADIWRKVIIPTDTPDFKEYKVDLNTAIDTALQNRPELAQNALTIKQAEINYSLGLDQKKWQFDFVGSFGANGVAGPQTVSAAGTPLIREDLIGGMPTAYKNIFARGFTNWSVGFQVTIPLKNRSLESQLAQIQVQKRQYLMQRKNSEQAIQVDVRNAVQSVETNKKRVEQSKVARQLSQEQLDGEEKRFQAGLSENFRVLDRQNVLSQAQFSELQALIAYRKSIITLQTAMYTLLEANDFDIAKTSSDNVAKFK